MRAVWVLLAAVTLAGCDVHQVPRYTIAKVYDRSIAGRKRLDIRVVIQDFNANENQVKDALRDAAKRQDADVVSALGYWPGDPVDTGETAGMLDWSSKGQNWSGDGSLPEDGEFTPHTRPGK